MVISIFSFPPLILGVGIRLRTNSMKIRFDPQIKAGDILTSVSIFISAIALIVSSQGPSYSGCRPGEQSSSCSCDYTGQAGSLAERTGFLLWRASG